MNDFNVVETLESMIDAYPEIQKQAENKALNTIIKFKDNALFFNWYKEIYVLHEYNKLLRKTLTHSKAYTNHLYDCMDGKK